MNWPATVLIEPFANVNFECAERKCPEHCCLKALNLIWGIFTTHDICNLQHYKIIF